ncbi:serine/threonine protein kinase [Cupriavidus agavae]|uniref:Stress response kinase A n=1 Tax=Cupriavidus agavae TaxID=1001822 RepID=A0A4Q7S9B7_9BURK|nr:serine/threonine protein kinase [Cupriavidus agavae]RZT43076.1 Ser/Thr protein kinase RdoA (MazF antagonist) [Cupriavidus agavae]
MLDSGTAPQPDDEVPYAGLTPECILDALESAGYLPDGRLLALNSYENRVWQVGIEDAAPVIAKFYRPGRWSDAAILEEHAFVQQLADAEIPAVPALGGAAGTLLTHAGFRFAVFPRCGGREPALDQRETREWLGRFIGRIHAVGAAAPYQSRPAIDPDTFGVAPRDYLLSHDCIPAELLAPWRAAVDLALDAVRRCYERAGAVRLLRLHGDCHRGNVLWIDEADARGRGAPGPHFVDFDDSRMGPAVQDLWMLLEGDRAAMQDQLADIVAGYEDFAEFDTRELWLVEALRTLRLLHYSAWLASRWRDPAFPAAFPWFGTARYWQDRILELREQIALMDEPPLWATA